MAESHATDRLNFFLIWGSLLAAFLFPFELFLFSYAVLGPLHYMTEINWLDQKNYFLRNPGEKRSYIRFSLGAIAILAVAFFINELGRWDTTREFYQRVFRPEDGGPMAVFAQWGYTMLFAVFILAVTYHLSSNHRIRLVFLGLAVLLTFLFFRFPSFAVWIGIFLPTVFHVFLFTFLFMLAGTLRNRSSWGTANLVSLVFAIWIIVAWDVLPEAGSVKQGTLDAFIASNFHAVNFSIGRALGQFGNNSLEIYSPAAWKIQVFLAFAYTYHYLNWFSKTSVIHWHKVDRRKMKWAVVFWLLAVGMYAMNYRLGFVALFVLSMLHVILEFPLNVGTVRTLFQHLAKRVPAVKSPAT